MTGVGAWLREARAATGDFLRRVYTKADQDKIFFMAGAIAFNVIVAIVPLALAAIGIAGLVLQQRFQTAAGERVVEYMLQALPDVSAAFREDIAGKLNQLLQNSSGFTLLGIVIFAWLATRLVGTLRTALREVFDINQDRNIIAGKLFDMQMVVVAGTLLALNVGFTVALEILATYSVDVLGMPAYRLRQNIAFPLLAFMSLWVMFVLVYRYLPARRIQWRTAFISATFASVLFEVLKQIFAWYARNAKFSTTYGNFAFFAIVVIYIYYMAIVFILGGEVGQVAALLRIRRRQKERLG